MKHNRPVLGAGGAAGERSGAELGRGARAGAERLREGLPGTGWRVGFPKRQNLVQGMFQL